MARQVEGLARAIDAELYSHGIGLHGLERWEQQTRDETGVNPFIDGVWARVAEETRVVEPSWSRERPFCVVRRGTLPPIAYAPSTIAERIRERMDGEGVTIKAVAAECKARGVPKYQSYRTVRKAMDSPDEMPEAVARVVCDLCGCTLADIRGVGKPHPLELFCSLTDEQQDEVYRLMQQLARLNELERRYE